MCVSVCVCVCKCFTCGPLLVKNGEILPNCDIFIDMSSAMPVPSQDSFSLNPNEMFSTSTLTRNCNFNML